MHDPHETIAAIASAAGGAMRGVIRMSGPHAVDCVAPIWTGEDRDGPPLSAIKVSTRLTGSLAVDGFTSAVPCSLLVWPTSRSYTRQPSVEIHTVGVAPILQAILRTLCRHGARLAAPGEFTLRAFLAGRIDLTQAEAVLGVIESRDRHELDVAVSQLAGGLGAPLVRLRDELLDVLAHLEAGLDFVEEDIEFIARDRLREQITTAAAQVRELAERTATRAVLRDAVRVVLVGEPNVGKSSLFNALLKRSAALVSPLAGTTRDYLVGELSLGDVTIELVDTAGLAADSMADSPHLLNSAENNAPQTDGKNIDVAAQLATVRERRHATIEVLCLDCTRSLTAWERSQLELPAHRVVVLTKVDQQRVLGPIEDAIGTSGTTGQGLAALCERLRGAALACGGDSTDVVAATAARCHESLQRAAEALSQALEFVDQHIGEELVAAELRAAIEELGHVVGAVYTDDLLDRIFSRFCIGK
ncbi:MAG TPA: tRNA modification GTPase [Pirellulales bacterium]|jgi:tRNA modification GTPase